MSNPVLIQPTRFVDLDLDGTEMGTSYGLRVSDDHASTYTTWIDDFAEIASRSPREIVAMAKGIDEIARSILEAAEENGSAVTIGGGTYDWAELGTDAPTP